MDITMNKTAGIFPYIFWIVIGIIIGIILSLNFLKGMMCGG